MKKILEMANNFNINESLDTNLSMSLGSGVMTLKELTNAYAIIANGGKKIEPKLITSIYSKDGKKIYDTSLKKCLECRVDVSQTETLPIVCHYSLISSPSESAFFV